MCAAPESTMTRSTFELYLKAKIRIGLGNSSSETYGGMVSCRRDDELAPEVFDVTFVSPDGLIDALDAFKLFCGDMFPRSSSSRFFLLQ